LKYGAFLRGINLGSRRRVASADLRSCFESLGFEDVSTFRTSGNVVFRSGRLPGMNSKIQATLKKTLGFDISVFLRTEKEMRAIAKHRPFPPRLVRNSGGNLQVALLSTKPVQRLRKQVLELATGDDRLAFGERELYWLPSGGTRDSTLDYAEIEKLLGLTTRLTKGTLEQMVEKYFTEAAD
jgi:uncharacterized protein (DUF1697 family)